MKKNVLLVIVAIVAVLVIWFAVQVPSDSPVGLNVNRIATEVVDEQAVLLDVRTFEERETDGYAVNSTHFDLARLESGELPDIATDQKVYTYCKGGTRAGKAEAILEAAGFTDVENIGGLSDWEAAGGAVVR